MVIAIALILLALGSVLFYFLSPWHLTPLASNWGSIDDTITVTFVVTGLVFVIVNLFMAYTIVRYRFHRKKRAEYQPENKKLEGWLTGLTAIGIGALLAPGLFVWNDFVSTPDEAQPVEIVGQQWHWSFRFPGEDGRFGRISNRLVSEDNPFGMDPDDPRGRDDVLVRSPVVELPVDVPVKTMLRSKDVIHNFQVAQFRAKMDMIPGQVSTTWFTPTREGDFEILCAELCGIGHFAMRGKVRVVGESEFEKWLDEQPTWKEMMARDGGDPEQGKALYQSCVSCHGEKGQGNPDLNAPKLAGLEDWYLIEQLQKFKNGVRGQNTQYGQQMKPFANMLADREAMADVAAYIDTLPDKPVEATVEGDPERGGRFYRTCANCHGPKGEGVRVRNAPRLAGLSDWYLERQLKQFRQDNRGEHPDDMYGWQMAEMAKVLTDEQAVRDVVAYINTLPNPSQTADESKLAGRSD